MPKTGPKLDDLTGIYMNNLTIIKRIFVNGLPTWEAKCNCGNIAYVRSRSSLKKRIGCASCTYSKRSHLRNKSKNHYSYKKRKMKEYIFGAKKRNLIFLLTEYEFFNFLKGDCYYCNEPPIKKTSVYANKYNNNKLYINGIDRKDSSIGYELNNCVSCCSKCNYAKHEMSIIEFKSWITLIYNNFIKKSSTTIPKGSTSEVYADGKGKHPIKDDDIV